MYRQAIVVFGMVIPGVLLVAALVAIWVMIGKFEANLSAKEETLKKGKQMQTQEMNLKSKLAPRRGQMEYWNEHLEADTAQSLNENRDKIMARYDGNQLRLLSSRSSSSRGGFGDGLEARANLFDLTFEGGYGPMQKTLAELEALMPQLVLERLKITPGTHTGQGYQRSLKFEVTYMAWSK